MLHVVHCGHLMTCSSMLCAGLLSSQAQGVRSGYLFWEYYAALAALGRYRLAAAAQMIGCMGLSGLRQGLSRVYIHEHSIG